MGSSLTDPKPNSGLAVYRRLLGYVLPYWRVFSLAILTLVCFAATEPMLAALVKSMLDGSFVEQDPTTIRRMPLIIIGLFLLRAVLGFASNYSMTWVGRGVIRNLRQEMFDHLLRLPAGYYDAQASGTLVSKLAYDAEQVAKAATDALTILLRDTLTMLGLLGWMFYLNWKISLIFVIVGPVITLVIYTAARRFRSLSSRLQDSMGELTQITEESIGGHLVTKIFAGEERQSEGFSQVNRRNRGLHLKWAVADLGGTHLVQMTVACALAGIVYAASTFAANDATTVGGFVSFLAAMIMLMAPIKRLTRVNGVIQRGIAASISVYQMLDESPEDDSGRLELARVAGRIDYRDVSFAYGAENNPVLDAVSFSVEPGQTVALVGKSGGGKSTLVSLLSRYYDGYSGTIEVDGTNIRELTLRNLREQIGLVSQSVVLFNDSVANNVAYARPEGASRGEIKRALEAAHALEFVEQMPYGLDSRIGDDGVLLSGGQRQRIAIARALLKDAPILILDEATSALDSESEQAIQAALDTLTRQRTTLVIAHRLSTIENADQILVVEGGRIVERGRHADLLRVDGAYARLYRLQFEKAGRSEL
ncbi:MAG: lipid A export permease/ATP-binding protein MsbA [Gammaproteobacteria bacterium]|nr:lipid A export permease/ATP-binding protein MsbA [Gammaproteobacteria bacterium]